MLRSPLGRQWGRYPQHRHQFQYPVNSWGNNCNEPIERLVGLDINPPPNGTTSCVHNHSQRRNHTRFQKTSGGGSRQTRRAANTESWRDNERVAKTQSPGVFRWLATEIATPGHSNCSRLDIGGSSPPHLLILQDSAIPELVAGEGLLIPWRKPVAGSSPACRAISFQSLSSCIGRIVGFDITQR